MIGVHPATRAALLAAVAKGLAPLRAAPPERSFRAASPRSPRWALGAAVRVSSHRTDRADPAGSKNPLSLLVREAQGEGDEASRAWLQNGLATWLRANGNVPLERCQRLPTTPARLRIAQRDFYLKQVASALQARTAWERSSLVSTMLAGFLSRGRWAQGWKNLEDPPANADRAESDMFYLAKLNNGRELSARQVHRILDPLM